MNLPALSDLTAFVTIANHRSFRKAADELGVSPSTLSHVMRGLERDMDVRLLHRTTRSVALTEAGERLLARLQPVLQELTVVLDGVNDFRERPAGKLRINSSETAARLLLQSVVPVFLARYPEVALDLVTENRLVDIVAEGFDAGIRLGETLPQDMHAVAFGGRLRFLAVAAPAYLAEHPAPRTPDELAQHRCIRGRMPSGKLYRWDFEKQGQSLSIDPVGILTLDHLGLMVEAAGAGMGIAYVFELAARPWLEAGTLVPVLADWAPTTAGLSLYYPGHRHMPLALRAFIDVLNEVFAP